MNVKEKIAVHVEKYLQDGEIVNLGIGIPTLVANYIHPEKQISLHSENGILGVDALAKEEQIDQNLVNAGKIPITIQQGASYFDSAASFSMIRGGHVDVAVLGALQVDQKGCVANWSIPGQSVLGVGGAMDLVEGVRRVIIATTHTTRKGEPKLVREVRYPLTSMRPVYLIVTDLAVFEVVDAQLNLIELLPGVSLQEVEKKTEAKFQLNLK